MSAQGDKVKSANATVQASTASKVVKSYAQAVADWIAANDAPDSPSVLFFDDFDGPSGSPPDPAKWWATPWTPAGNKTTSFNAANAYLDGNSNLILKVSPGTKPGIPFDGARIQTFVEGSWPPAKVLWSAPPPIRIEMRAKFVTAPGLWGALWTNSNSPGGTQNLEIDLQEFRGAVPREVTSHTHGLDEWGAVKDSGADLSADWHVYRCDYWPSGVSFFLDDALLWTRVLPSAPPQMLRLTHEVGDPGTWGGQGGPPAQGAYLMRVDWVRVSGL